MGTPDRICQAVVVDDDELLDLEEQVRIGWRGQEFVNGFALGRLQAYLSMNFAIRFEVPVDCAPEVHAMAHESKRKFWCKERDGLLDLVFAPAGCDITEELLREMLSD